MSLTQKDIWRIAVRVVDHGMSTDYVAGQFNVSRRRVQQIGKVYRETGKIPVPKTRGRPIRNDVPANLEDHIIRARKKLRVGAVGIGHYLRKRLGIHVGNDRIHSILAASGYVKENPKMKGKRKRWIRYERSQSLSAAHIDWHLAQDDRWVCFVEDDSSRMILAGGEYDRRSADAAIDLVQSVLDQYGSMRRLREIISDHGAEFYANKRDEDGNAEHRFEIFCRVNGIKQILCRYNHPQSNGKIEKWFDTYDRHRPDFETLDEFIHWYNCVRPHMSLDYKNLETPEQAFWERLRGYVLGAFMDYCEREGYM